MKKSNIGICVIILFLILSPWITHFLVTTPTCIGFITPENQDTWIGFFGAIIGGGATLVGVWWTIYSQETQRKEDLAIQYKPVLSLIFLNETTIDYPITNTVLSFSFELKNIGRGELTNISVEYTQYNSPYSFRISYAENQTIFQNNTANMLINIFKTPNLSLEKKEAHSKSVLSSISINEEINFTLSIIFNDAFLNRYTYTYKIKFDHKASIDLQNVSTVSFDNGIPNVKLNNSNHRVDTTPKWIAHISAPKIEFKEK